MMDPEFHALCPTPRRLQTHCLSDISWYHPLRSSYLGKLPTQDHSLPLLLLFLSYHPHRPRLRSSRLPTQARKRLDRHHQPHTRSQVAVNQAMRSHGSQNCKACQASRAVDHRSSPQQSAPPELPSEPHPLLSSLPSQPYSCYPLCCSLPHLLKGLLSLCYPQRSPLPLLSSKVSSPSAIL